MSVERKVRGLAGSLVLISLALGLLVSPYWFIMTGIVGFNLFQSSITGFCPAEKFFKEPKKQVNAPTQ
ncbi:MAG: DUF2892 domain-containing protein [Candidatus Zixiibacteriota bacterium]